MPSTRARIVELQVHRGLAPVLAGEVAERLPAARVVHQGDTALSVSVRPGDLAAVTSLRTAVAAYLERHHPVPRPRALLGHEAVSHTAADIALATEAAGRRQFTSLRIAAAGADSAVFRRLAGELSERCGLPHDQADGDLVVRVVRGRDGQGWRVLVRLTPRPLSARTWHQPGFRGALDAAVAAAMVRLSRPTPADVFLDPTCGSGTLLVERLLAGRAACAVGTDLDPAALAVAAANARAARVPARLVAGDACRAPLRPGSVTALCANPPWGHQMGTHRANERLYPALLAEAGVLARPGARFVVVTHEITRMTAALAGQDDWATIGTTQVALRGHHPVIWELRRRS